MPPAATTAPLGTATRQRTPPQPQPWSAPSSACWQAPAAPPLAAHAPASRSRQGPPAAPTAASPSRCRPPWRELSQSAVPPPPRAPAPLTGVPPAATPAAAAPRAWRRSRRTPSCPSSTRRAFATAVPRSRARPPAGLCWECRTAAASSGSQPGSAAPARLPGTPRTLPPLALRQPAPRRPSMRPRLAPGLPSPSGSRTRPARGKPPTWPWPASGRWRAARHPALPRTSRPRWAGRTPRTRPPLAWSPPSQGCATL
mmetsp:Transcript_10261/g.39891  ORF Transcript_10261/g.39891 Transcript_10261/m.39891 type:complete len:256 (-) Transcript_10261:902-1669(-)